MHFKIKTILSLLVITICTVVSLFNSILIYELAHFKLNKPKGGFSLEA